MKNIAIIGAGPCGLMAAEILASAGYTVTVYDRMASPARKLLIAGRGGLNLTHSENMDKFITRYGKAAEWLTPCIEAFPPQALRDWCESLGEETFTGSSGRVFPKNMKAVQLLRAWLKKLDALGVEYKPRHNWLGWDGEVLKFDGGNVNADAVLLALGGASWPRLGSDGKWAEILPEITAPLKPSNCGFVVPWSEYFSHKFAGQPLKPVAVTHAGITRQGEAMITAEGIEGGVIYALSANIREAIEVNGKTIVYLDLRPDMDVKLLEKKLEAPRGNKSLSNYLRGLGFSPLAISLLRETNMELSAGALKAVPVTLTATAGIARAISSAGGIKREELDDNFMLKSRPGVFAAGEMLDWEAPTGGYLLQACFSTGVAAARGVERYLG